AAAAAEIPRQIIANLLIRWPRNFIEQRLGRQNKPRCTIAALECAELHEGFLERMQSILFAKPFDGQNFAPVRVHSQDRTSTHRLAIKQQRASPTDLNVAP